MFDPQNQQKSKTEVVISYTLLRRLIGLLGISLPILLPIGNGMLSQAEAVQPSISHYYYSTMHVVFVGVLCLLGGFLVSYRGPHPLDNITSNLAGAFAIGVASFPTNHEGFIPQDLQYLLVPSWQEWMNWIHYGSAGSLFACFAFFCFKIFKSDDSGMSKDSFDEKKKKRNRFYHGCGLVIVISIGCIGAISLYEWLVAPLSFSTYSTIFFETTSLFAFGSSWLLKGTYGLKNAPKALHRVIKSYRQVDLNE